MIMPVNRNSQQSKTHAKPKVLNSIKKPSTNFGKIPTKKRSNKKPCSPPPVNSGFSLYSSASESGDVSSLNRGLDRCAALLANILDDDESIVQHHAGTKQPLSQKGTPLKVGNKKSNGNTAKTQKQIPRTKKTQPKQSNAPKKCSSSTHKHAEKNLSNLSSEPAQNGKSAPELIKKGNQTTQFNDRLVSSTPDMGSPTSVTHDPKNFDEIPNQSKNPHKDASLEALAAQIQMLRSQAEKAEASHHQGSDNIPVRDTTGYIDSGNTLLLQEQTSMQPVVQQDKADGPGQMLTTLSDHIRNANIRNPVNQSHNMTPPLQYSQDPNHYPSQFTQHQMSIDRHQFQDLSQLKVNSAPNYNQQSTKLSSAPPSGSFEPRDSRNTSFLGEYHQLPNRTIKPDGSSDLILNQLKEIETVSTTPQKTFQDKANSNVPHSRTFINQMDNRHIPTQLVDCGEMKSPYLISPQIRANQVVHQNITPSEMTPNRTVQFTPRMICMGTQTYSPPADKGVQTSAISSPSSPETVSSQESVDCKPSSDSDSDSSKTVSSKNVAAANLQDTPHPLSKFSSGKKSASWEQMRVLRFLLGELRSAISDTGEDREVARLITEMHECMDTLQYLPLDLQTEIGLALQPLRSENSQLRRRLRIANQQIRQLQNGPEKENLDPPVDVEVLTLQSLNAKLQKELREEMSEKKRLADSNAECIATVDTMKQKQRDFMILLQQKDAHQLQSRQEWLDEKSALKHQIDEMQTQLNDLHLRIEAVNKENSILQFSLKQRDSEIIRLKNENNPMYPSEMHCDFHTGDNNNISENDSISEVDSDDVTPTGSPQQSPCKYTNPTSTRNTLSPQHSPCKFPKSSSSRTQDAYPYPSMTKKVTFAEYSSPNAKLLDNVINVPMTRFDAVHSDVERLDRFKTPNPYQKQICSNKYQIFNNRGASFHQDLSENGPKHDYVISSVISNETNMVDKEFSMRKFLEQSRHCINEESEVSEAEPSDDTLKLTPNSICSTTFINQRDLADKISNEQFCQRNYDRKGQNHERRTFSSFPCGPSQETTFQGSVLDRSTSSTDCTSTQSSVTSQYEAQFQLGLANLDSEIAKLQSSLKSINQT